MPEPTDVPESTGITEPTGIPEIMITDAIDDQALVSLIGVSVLAVDGVTRLEPSVKSLFQARIGSSSGPERPDGIAVTSLGAITDITVDLSTTARHQSRVVAESVQLVVRDVLETHGREAGQIRVNVLSIDQGPSAA